MSLPSHITNIYELLDEDGEFNVPMKAPVKDIKAPAKTAVKPAPQQVKTQQSADKAPRDNRRERTDRPQGDRPQGDRPPRQDRQDRQDRPPRQDRQDRPPRQERTGVAEGETQRQPVEFARRYDRDQVPRTGESRGDARRRGAADGGFDRNRRYGDRKSGSGRPPREEKRGGKGVGNWGPEDGSEDVVPADGEQVKEAIVAAEPEYTETPEEKAEREEKEKTRREEKEKEDKQIGYDAYLKLQEEKRARLSALSKTQEVRKANDGADANQQKQWNNYKVVEREALPAPLLAATPAATPAAATTENAEEKKDKKKTVRVDQVFKIKETPRRQYNDDDRDGFRGGRGGRGGSRGGSRGGRGDSRGGRGGSRGGRGGSQQAASGSTGENAPLFSTESFPSLH